MIIMPRLMASAPEVALDVMLGDGMRLVMQHEILEMALRTASWLSGYWCRSFGSANYELSSHPGHRSSVLWRLNGCCDGGEAAMGDNLSGRWVLTKEDSGDHGSVLLPAFLQVRHIFKKLSLIHI